MKFDTIIIGGGLAGLACGIRLAQNNQRCAIVSSGQSSLCFFSGSFDLLGHTSEDKPVYDLLESLSILANKDKKHPYSKIGVSKIEKLLEQSYALLNNLDIKMKGDVRKNHFRLTPMGTTRPTWLSVDTLATSPSADKLPWRTLAVCNLQGFTDFPHQIFAEQLASLGVKVNTHSIKVRFLDSIRQNATEMRSASIARLLEKTENLEELAKALNLIAKDNDAILLPAALYSADGKAFGKLKNMVLGTELFLLPTMPPSVVGLEIESSLITEFKAHGGVFFAGDSVLKGEIQSGKVQCVYTANHGDIPMVADNYVLATGSFFNKGLIATNTSIYEPIFDCDVEFLPNRGDWYSKDLFTKQNYFGFGVKTTSSFKALSGGNPVDNLYAIGSVLSDFNPVEEGSGAGVALLTALNVANHLLDK
ncbi:glycerol-3-phosphate dehydrogenase subunit GlpB [Dysgonomonas sp. 511]|uniref:glycerol-3-phosphate dehydrogenase subunit GlpB n=1 Tax=Dysgonomonas sp. 511 TaxID=2302930 RepID=UPI0013D2533C|nr:glycerol-3-phosphate dehydrogenase subunit GlpB [Dysgonomonas sp. 511]NDV79291.1 glycerol-3-phosphate dehydrogenase subunit GlpB [Dysgonomonas sp. 511]